MSGFKNKALLILLVSLSNHVLGQTNAGYYPLIQNIYGRNTQSLNGHWNRLPDPLKSGYFTYRKTVDPNGYFNDVKVDNRNKFKEYGFDDAPWLYVPGDWNTQEDKLYYYEGAIWYKRIFNFSGTSARQFLYFGAVNYEAKVYLNGEKVGEHEGGYTPFNIEVTNKIKLGENSLIVLVDNTRRADAVPTDNFDWWNYGGITRDVMLVETPETFIRDYKIQLKKGSQSQIEVSVKFDGNNKKQSIKFEIPELKISKTIPTNTDGTATLDLTAKLNLWSTSNPKLYKVTLSSENEKVEDEIGFRTIEVKNDKVLLNGNPVFLKGICIHEEALITTRRAFSLVDAKALLDKAQEAGCNFVRLAHYPHNEFMVREAERRGMLVWSEIPVYWTIDFKNPLTLVNATNQLNEMINRDKNRASVIIWSLANETPHGDARDKFLTELIEKTREFDNTRLVSMAMEKSQINDTLQTIKDNMMNKVDIISFNQYIGWYNGTWELTKRSEWDLHFNKPIIVSEFGGEALYGKHGTDHERWTEEYQAELYKQTLNMLDRIPELAGVTPWILADFRSPKRLNPTIQGEFNRKGIYSERGEPKMSMYILRDWYKKK